MATKVKDLSLSTPLYRASLNGIYVEKLVYIRRRFKNENDENYSTFDLNIGYNTYEGVRGDKVDIDCYTTDLERAKSIQRDMIKKHLDEARVKFEEAQKKYLDLIEKYRTITNIGVPNEQI